MKLSLYQRTKSAVYKHLIRPILESVSPVREVAWATLIGLFVGLTPTVGIQMWIVSSIWLFCRYILRFRFNLVVGNAMVWITNPITMGPMYYGFLITGLKFFSWIGYHWPEISYSSFKGRLFSILREPNFSTWDIFIEGSRFLFVDLGYPMVLGSLLWAFPLSILAFFITTRYLHIYRKNKAESLGMTYETWKAQYEIDE